jgi:hypothetical protein
MTDSSSTSYNAPIRSVKCDIEMAVDYHVSEKSIGEDTHTIQAGKKFYNVKVFRRWFQLAST